MWFMLLACFIHLNKKIVLEKIVNKDLLILHIYYTTILVSDCQYQNQKFLYQIAIFKTYITNTEYFFKKVCRMKTDTTYT